MPWGDVTTKDKSMFLSVFDWPQDGKLYLPGLKMEILSARWLKVAKAEKISFEQQHGWTIFNVPFQAGDTPASVIELTFKSNPEPADVDPTLGLSPNSGKHTIKVSLVDGDPETSSLESVYIYPIN